MQEQKSGHIINMASVFGIKVFAPGGTVYCATKLFGYREPTQQAAAQSLKSSRNSPINGHLFVNTASLLQGRRIISRASNNLLLFLELRSGELR